MASTLSGSRLVLRDARITDRPRLFHALSDGIYGGHDYLPLFFEKWLHDDLHHMIVAEMEEATTAAEPHPELVGLDTIGLYDQGATVLFQAMRVNPRFRGQGLAKELSEGVRRLALARFPNVRRLRAVIQHHHTSSIRVHVAQGYQCLHREAFGMAAIDGRGMTALARRYATAAALLVQLSETCGGSAGHVQAHAQSSQVDVRLVTARELWAGLAALDATKRAQLLPHNLFLVDWMPYEATLDNLCLMEQSLDMAFLAALDSQTGLVGLAVCQRSARCSGQHLFACVRCDGDPMLFARLADAALVLFWHGCAYLCLSYDQALRDKISPAEDRPDARPVPCLTAMATRLPLDFSADYMHGSQAVYELAIEHAST